MKRLISAITFITILPLGKSTTYDPKGMIPFFPIVGLILGTLLSIFDAVALQLWPRPVVSILDVVLLAMLTGAFHLDGLGDAADGLLSHRSREKALAIMKAHPLGEEACMIGEVIDDAQPLVTMRSKIGATRIVDMLSGEQLPRIC